MSESNLGQNIPPSDPKPPNLTPQIDLTAPSPDWAVDTLQLNRSKKRNHQHLSESDYGSLSSESLIQIIKDLQAENKQLLQILAQTTAVNSQQNSQTTSQEFTFTSNPELSTKDFPALKKTAPAKKNTPAKSGKSPTGNTNNKKKFSFQKPITPEAKSWALRLFTAPPTTNSTQSSESQPPRGFTFVYLPSNRKTPHPELRERLRFIGIQLSRVYNISYPAKNVVALLVHKAYADEIYSLVSLAGISALKDFNPISGSTIGDPQLLADFTPEQLEDKAKSLFFNRMLKAAVQLQNPKFGLHILKEFNNRSPSDNHHIPDAIVQQYIHLRPTAVRNRNHVTARASFLGGFDASQLFTSLHDTTSLNASKTLNESPTAKNNTGNPVNHTETSTQNQTPLGTGPSSQMDITQ